MVGAGFRPLSWGLSFNGEHDGVALYKARFRPLSWGLSFNSVTTAILVPLDGAKVFVPFLGDFLSMVQKNLSSLVVKLVFVPFLGDFLSIGYGIG